MRTNLTSGLIPLSACSVSAPDMPGIDIMGARKAGLHPILMDPFGLHDGGDYDRVGSLQELAARVES